MPMIVCTFIRFEMSGGDKVDVGTAIELMLFFVGAVRIVNELQLQYKREQSELLVLRVQPC